MNILQDIMGLIAKRKVNPPTDKDYLVVASYTDTQEILKPQPKMQANLVSIGALKKFVQPNITPTYKVFTALLTQSGGDDPQTQSGGNTIIGVTYTIGNNGGPPGDWTNIGAPNNNVGTSFIATGTIPADWGDGFLDRNDGAPVATVLENTIGNIWFTYVGDGWNANSDNLFINGKVFVTSYSYYNADKDSFITCGVDIDQGTGVSYLRYINVDNNAGTREAYNTPIEIRVYN